jgi:hypothetical protein
MPVFLRGRTNVAVARDQGGLQTATGVCMTMGMVRFRGPVWGAVCCTLNVSGCRDGDHIFNMKQTQGTHVTQVQKFDPSAPRPQR